MITGEIFWGDFGRRNAVCWVWRSPLTDELPGAFGPGDPPRDTASALGGAVHQKKKPAAEVYASIAQKIRKHRAPGYCRIVAGGEKNRRRSVNATGAEGGPRGDSDAPKRAPRVVPATAPRRVWPPCPPAARRQRPGFPRSSQRLVACAAGARGPEGSGRGRSRLSCRVERSKKGGRTSRCRPSRRWRVAGVPESEAARWPGYPPKNRESNRGDDPPSGWWCRPDAVGAAGRAAWCGGGCGRGGGCRVPEPRAAGAAQCSGSGRVGKPFRHPHQGPWRPERRRGKPPPQTPAKAGAQTPSPRHRPRNAAGKAENHAARGWRTRGTGISVVAPPSPGTVGHADRGRGDTDGAMQMRPAAKLGGEACE